MREIRPDPDALLAQVESDGEHSTRGRLKIFFGAAPGVGKTYAMLGAAREVAAEGEDVLVGYVEPHARRETLALTLGLDFLPRRSVEHGGTTLEEFDLEGALKRRPKLILVDELAHTNAPGSTHAKRWQDVDQLLDAGINVYTTLNVQHLESLNDVIARITGVVVRETVPDAVFDAAHEVELIDLPPDDLIERLREGKVYVVGQAARAIDNYFKKGNLFALRELALRRTAERVGAQVQGYRQAHAISGTWQSSERLLVCVSPSPLSGRLVRAGRRMASSLNAPWIAVYVETPATVGLGGVDWERLQRHLQLAERLGAQTATLSGVNVIDELLHYARRQNVTKILVGKPQEPRWKELLRGSFVYELTRKCGDIDVYVISGETDGGSPRGRPAVQKPSSRLPYLGSALIIAVCTGVGWLVSMRSASVNVIMVYLIGVVLASLRFGQGPSVLASVLAVAAFDFFFVEPQMNFAVGDTEYLFTFAVMLATGLVISSLMSRVRVQADLARRREQRTSALYSLTKALSGLLTLDDVVRAVVRDAGAACDAQVVVLLPDPLKGLAAHASPGGFTLSERDLAVARWVHDNRRTAGLGTDTLPSAESLFLPLIDAGQAVGVLGVRPSSPELLNEPERFHLVETLASQAAVALGRLRYAEDAERIKVEVETERMRNTLLSSVSHDLRTPLTAIAGASSALVEAGDAIPSNMRRELLESILDESEALNRLVGNLLDATRLEGGALLPNKDWQSMEELLGVVYGRLARPLHDHPVRSDVPPDLPLFAGDGALIQQVLQNLLENAVKYSPSGSPIDVKVEARDAAIVVEVADRGPGLPEGEGERIFEKFRRAPHSRNRTGAGLGLAICRGVVNLHGGRIWAENRPGGGAVFRFSLPLGDAAPMEPEAEAS
ncbi:MAG: sensor histidine kinase KdpD [Paludisphaera borealis]|uniref:sensor histidine kinase KdpD n=1 Tax=Paludisphaera borealis TaxID=1387353 RepID=UPI002845CE2C|nr:sensor histidine kinase KdpD [Paludisphaera borealis]MDR3619404.1 sensor histidine kinase KdpD [Paludisphaera borealis]